MADSLPPTHGSSAIKGNKTFSIRIKLVGRSVVCPALVSVATLEFSSLPSLV